MTSSWPPRLRGFLAGGLLLALVAGCGGVTAPGPVQVDPIDQPAPVRADERVVAPISPALKKCLHRFDDVPEPGGPEGSKFRKRGGLRVWFAVTEAIHDRFDSNETPVRKKKIQQSFRERALPNGYIDSAVDNERNRIVVILDPRRTDLHAASRHLNKVAAQAQRQKPVRGTPISVEVFAGCFPAMRLLDAYTWVRDEGFGRGVQVMFGPELDSRLRVGVHPDRADTKADLERRFGSMITTFNSVSSKT